MSFSFSLWGCLFSFYPFVHHQYLVRKQSLLHKHTNKTTKLVFKTYLVATVGQSGVAFRQDALHSQEERPLDLVVLLIDARMRQLRRQHGRHFVVIGRMDVFVDAVSGQLYLEQIRVRLACFRIERFGGLTCDKPRCTEAVSDMYMILPSGATTKMKPSKVWRRYEPSSLIGVSLWVWTTGVAPHASPKPEMNLKSKNFM